MAKVRIGFSTHFEVENELVGIGTDNPTNTKQVLGNIHATNAKAIGITTHTTYQGFVDSKARIEGAGGAKSGSLSGEIIIEGEVTVSSGTTFTSGPKNLTVTNKFTLPKKTTYAPTVGSMRFNENLSALEFYTGSEWRTVNSRVDMGNSGRCVFFGGFISPGDRTDQIDYINAFTLGNAVNFGTLSETTRMSFAGQSGNAIRGLCVAFWPANLDLIEYVTIASQGNGIEFGNLTAGRQQGGVTSSSTRSVTAGGEGQTNVMEYVEIMTTGNAIDFGDLSVARRALAGCGSPTRGIYSGGGDGGTIGAHDDYITIASKGDATKFRDCHFFCRNTKMASNSVRGVYALGYTVAPENNAQQILECITIATLGNVTYFGDMMATTNDAAFIGAGNRGIIVAGWSPTSPTIVNTIQYVNITTTGNAVDFGDYTRPTSQLAGTSDCHGGLGGF